MEKAKNHESLLELSHVSYLAVGCFQFWFCFSERKITNPSVKTSRKSKSGLTKSPATRYKKPNSPPSRMKAILDSEVKDDTFIGTTCEVSISSGPQSTVGWSYSIFSSM